MKRVRTASVCAMAILAVASAAIARADEPAAADPARVLPPWSDPDDVPLPTWARSVAPKRAETVIVATPGRGDVRRGTTLPGVRLPFYGAKRAAGCSGRWLEVGPMAWICGDAADLSADEVYATRPRAADDGLPYRYYFVGAGGAYGWLDPTRALDDSPDQELEAGFGVAITEERDVRGERWGRTHKGRWIALRDLVPVRPTAFHGVEITAAGSGAPGAIDFGWVLSEVASVYSAPKPVGKPAGALRRFERVAWREERAAPGSAGLMVRVSEDGATPERWARARDLVRPTVAAPPPEVGGDATTERWIDVDVASQTLVAYDGARPVFATLVSTGKGARAASDGSDTATPLGVHRVWVKLATTDMDNLDREDDDEHYSIEDVPWVQFFDRAVALHAAFWHHDFGHPHSHGCVNLAPKDAAWLFAFTGPHLPAGWSASLPTPLERGTAIRVR